MGTRTSCGFSHPRSARTRCGRHVRAALKRCNSSQRAVEALVADYLPFVVMPGTTKGWVTPLPADSSRRLVIQGGFVADDGRGRRMQRRAQRHGFGDLRSYLQACCDTGVSIPALAEQFGVNEWMVKQALHAQGVVLPARPERLARQRWRFSNQRIAGRVAELGFADVRAYLADRLLERGWLLADGAAELGAHRVTVRRLLDQHGIRRARRTAGELLRASGGRRCSRSPGRRGGPSG